MDRYIVVNTNTRDILCEGTLEECIQRLANDRFNWVIYIFSDAKKTLYVFKA